MPKQRHHVIASLTLAALAAATPSLASAEPRAAYGTRGELPDEGVPHLLDVATLGEYARVTEPAKTGGLRDVGAFALRSRLYLGRAVSYCAGLDGALGGSNEGLIYGVTGYVAGLATRWGAGNVIALCGGAGVDRAGDAVPLAARVPADLSIALALGPVRPIVWVRPSWVPGSDLRRGGAAVSVVDELEAGILVRLSRQRRLWSRTSAGGGLAIGVNYRQLMQTHMIGLSLGLSFAGEQ
jgi:hypothetical protein